MDTDTEIDLDALHQAVVDTIRDEFTGFATVDDYREAGSKRDRIALPACLVELTDMEPDQDADPGTGQLAVVANFEARIVIGFRTLDAKREIRKAAASLAQFIYQQRWGLPVSPAEVVAIAPDNFEPELDQYEVWSVQWRHLIHLGDSVWLNEGGVIPTDVFLGFVPDVGTGHEHDYIQVAGDE